MGAPKIIKAPILPHLRETYLADIKIQHTTTGIYTPHSDDNIRARGLFLSGFAAYSICTHKETLGLCWWWQLTMGNGTLQHKTLSTKVGTTHTHERARERERERETPKPMSQVSPYPLGALFRYLPTAPPFPVLNDLKRSNGLLSSSSLSIPG